MLIKSCVLGAVLVSTPLCLLDVQEPATAAGKSPAAGAQEPRTAAELRRARAQLDRVRSELDGAKRDLVDVRRQLTELLDRLDERYETRRDRRATPSCQQSCSPSRSSSRSRELMSHYQWLEQNGHAERAQNAMARIVEQVGDNMSRMNSVAWDLMTEEETAGRFDRVALALAERMEQQGEQRRLDRNHLDTMALARFLNGQVERAIELEERAIAAGGASDDFRRRLRTYQAARDALAAADRKPAPAAADTIVAQKDEE